MCRSIDQPTTLLECTSRNPYLVSDICKIIDEQLECDWTVSGVRSAVNLTLGENNSLFDDMIKNIENNSSFKHFVRSILLEGQHFPFTISDSDISLGAMFGIMKKGQSGEVEISNMIFETYLYNHFIMERLKQGIGTGLPERSQYIDNGRLNMERVLLKFQELMECEYTESNGEFRETGAVVVSVLPEADHQRNRSLHNRGRSKRRHTNGYTGVLWRR